MKTSRFAWVCLFCVALLGCVEPEPAHTAPKQHVWTHPVIVAGAGCGLVELGTEMEGLSCLAKQHADSMARRQHQDHRGWEQRYSTIVGAEEASEICAESWPGESQSEAAAGCWKDWKQSPSHWRTANGHPLRYGVGMSQGKNGIWYTCIIATWG